MPTPDEAPVTSATGRVRAEGVSSASTVADLSEGLRGLIEFAHGDLETACRHLTRDMERVADPGQAFRLGSMALRAA
ncbi:hypothetical protein [Streptomyces sp. AC555_RSS877]|uniref:hypothetical protein n=1 Tax=Streptomyces sp. AC555_RSS877 TaxID=2823688 RepID=UPI001C274ABF|nr:hypothetical protein [Streptomyces sp. AC555_RSS877]